MLWFLLACQPEEAPTDMDGDGSIQGVDCTDVDPRRAPGNDEHCDGVDEDCDGFVDEEAVDALAWYADADADGYGVDSDFVVSCVALAGRVDVGGDCDDDDPTLAPDQLEHCDGVDENCDGTVDNDAIDGMLVYVDADGDGYGTGAGTPGCPADGAAADGDCDDADPAISPIAAEQCDGVDTNCDGSPDRGAEDGLPYWPDADGDGYGDPDGESFLDCEGSEGAPNRFDCDDTDAAIAPPAACGLPSRTGTGRADVVIYGIEANQRFGSALETVDIDGDGALELLVGAPGPDEGTAYVFSGLRGAETTDSALARREGDVAEALGTNLGAADIDGDGVVDLYAGAPLDANVSTRAGAVWVFRGPLSGRADVNEGYGVFGESVADQAGTDAAWVEDTTGDGLPDMVVGAAYSSVGGTYSGTVYVVPGPITDTFDMSLEAEHAWVHGSAANHRLGANVAGADLDGDGLSEVVMGAGGGYLAYVLPGGSVGEVDEDDLPLIGGRGGFLQVGTWFDMHPDINGDGYGDVLVGGPSLPNSILTAEGEAYILTGPITEDIDLDTDYWLMLEGEERDDGAAQRVRVGDTDGDGGLELIVSATATDHGGLESGSVYIHHNLRPGAFLMENAATRIDGHTTDLYIGESLAVGDLDGDGADEIAIGTTHESVGGELSGALYVFWGGGTD